MARYRRSFIGITSIAISASLALSPPLHADDFEGAAQLIEKLKSPVAPVSTPAAGTKDDYIHLAKDQLAFSKQSATLAPNEAARQWLALFDRGVALRESQSVLGMSSNLPHGILAVLPGPASWPELQKLAEARASQKPSKPQTEALLLLIVHTLNNAENKQWADLALLAAPSANPSGVSFQPALPPTFLLTLGTKLSAVASRSDDVETFWNHLLEGLEKSPASSIANEPYGSNLTLPDLVTLLGEAKARPLLLRALLLPGTPFSAIAGKDSMRVAQEVALANVEKLLQPPWFLTENLDGAALYEALAKKFPGDANGAAGALYHVLALVVQGRPQDAVKAASAINGANLEDASTRAVQAGYGAQVYDFLDALLKAQPESDSWNTYINLAAQMGHAPAALQFIQDTLAKKDLSDLARNKIQPVLYRALFAADKVDEGIAQLRTLIKTARPVPNADVISYVRRGNSMIFVGNREAATPERMVEWDLALARIGRVLKRDSLEEEGLADARSRMPKDALITYLMETGRNVEAEKLLIDAIVTAAAQEKSASNRFYGNAFQNEQNLVKLAQVYYNAGRWADIVLLLKQAPGWTGADLIDVAGEKGYSQRYTPRSLGLIAARALAETGQVELARPILDYTLRIDAGDDAAYALLLKIGKKDLVPKLDALYRQDQFQNRPLIWKATVLLQQGKVDEAEQACKAAIAVDPSDGETGKGDRMRVYSVMADVCTAQKDPKQAAFFHNVVKAIRLSEDADDFFDAGLLTRAVGMYAQALNLFSDAYCIQSRIARQLAELGRVEEACEHYRRAFELMPVSFGRMESHCFGCERAFEGKTATSIAEQVFTDMLAKDPKKPQLPYLLGYLYMEEQRYPEAIARFQKAAQLDPDYINAWKQILTIGNDYQLSPALRDEAVFNVLRLDPAGRHISPDTENVRQLAKLWAAEEASVRAIPPVPATLFPLDAAAAEIAARDEQAKKMLPNGFDDGTRAMLEEQIQMAWGRKPKGESAPRNAILHNGIITTALDFSR